MTPTELPLPIWTCGWTPLYRGIERAVNLSPDVPAALIPSQWAVPAINLLRVRMDDPFITTCSTPESGLSGVGVPLSQFLQTTFNAKNEIAIEGIVGVNANFFDISDPNSRNVLYGLAVSNLVTVPWKPRPDGMPYYPLLITEANHATIGGKNAPRTPDTWTAVSGNVLLLRQGQVMVPPTNPATPKPIVAARTAVGVSYDPLYLYLVAVDGLETNDFTKLYYGASDYDVAVLLRRAGATDAVNLDGGGSTTMGRIDANGFTLMNVPYGNDAPPSSERSVGNCFAVISRAPLEQGSDGR